MAFAQGNSDISEITTDQNQNTPQNSENQTTEMATHCDEPLSRLLQQMKTDQMYELRNIAHSHRPVTGQEHREHLHQFMKKHITDPNEKQGNVPSNVDDVAEHRPQSVIVEVQGVVEQRPVSSVLQSAAFRHRLENIIRGSLESSVRRQQTSSPRTVRSTRSSRSPSVPIPSPRQSSPFTAPQTTPENEVPRSNSTDQLLRPTRQRHNSTDSVDSFSSALSSVDHDEDFEEDSLPLPASQAATNYNRPIPTQRRTVPVSAPMEAPIAPNIANFRQPSRQETPEPDAGVSWNDIGRIHREEMVQELSELLHTRLVSSTLDGEFRATLEVLFENRVDSNGPAVQDFVQSLPGRGIPHNDFSHLGIGPFDIDNSDNISVTSVSTHSVPYGQTNVFLRREIQGLKCQMKEMMSMIKVTHDLQMDIQRAIRQEVSAALSQVTAEGACAASVPIAKKSKPVNDTHCLICLDQYSDTVLYQCGHMCVCYLCGKNLIKKKLCCPVCRAPIKDVIRAYKTNAD